MNREEILRKNNQFYAKINQLKSMIAKDEIKKDEVKKLKIYCPVCEENIFYNRLYHSHINLKGIHHKKFIELTEDENNIISICD